MKLPHNFTANNFTGTLNHELELMMSGKDAGKPASISIIEEWCKERDLETKYPALAAAREQYNIIKAICQESEGDLR